MKPALEEDKKAIMWPTSSGVPQRPNAWRLPNVLRKGWAAYFYLFIIGEVGFEQSLGEEKKKKTGVEVSNLGRAEDCVKDWCDNAGRIDRVEPHAAAAVLQGKMLDNLVLGRLCGAV